MTRIGKRDGFRCWLCGERFKVARQRGPDEEITIDHAIPKARGGSGHLSNLRLAHAACNNQRGHIAETPTRASRQRLEAISLRVGA